jgi:hypothetical protein
VPDVVGDWDLVRNLPGSQLPLRNRTLDEQARICVTLVVKLGVQRAEPDIGFDIADGFVLHNWNTILVANEILVRNRRLELLD